MYMENKVSNNIKLGIFVSISLFFIITVIYYIGKKKQLFSTTFQVSCVFTDINGLQVGNNVRFSGIVVGMVQEIVQISDTTVRVDLMINEDSRKFIKKNALAIIGTDGLMGNKIVSITPGTPGEKPINNYNYLTTAQPISVDEILANVKLASENAAVITDDLAAIMDNIRNGRGTIGKLFMDSVFAKNIDKSIVNIKDGSGGFKSNMEAASKNVLLRGFFKKKKKERAEKIKNK
jgi:phospholipid/cholesterol/gamma-HCH transport system substrate-binding protein